MENRLTKTMGAGLSALGGGRKTFFVIEHKTQSSKHKAGESQQIIVDYVEIGRDPKCAIRFGDDEKTVSRVHAAIVKGEDGSYLVRNLSATNPTLVNGRPVEKEWFLKNGDEIQLSMEGPKMAFLTPVNNKMSTIGMTKRLSLFARQALSPYRTQMRVVTIALAAALAIIIYMAYFYITGLKPETDKLVMMTKAQADSLQTLNLKNKNMQERFKKSMKDLEGKMRQTKWVNTANPNRCDTCSIAQELSSLYPGIYFILSTKIVVDYGGETQEINDYNWSGTGFLLTDGRLITARHVVEPWYFFNPDDPNDKGMINLNLYQNNGGKVTVYFTATSPDGSSFTFKNTDFKTDHSGDVAQKVPDKNGDDMTVYQASLNDGKDWASYKCSKTGKINFDNDLSENLKSGNIIHIIGYPWGMSLQGKGNLKPYYSRSTVAQDGLVNGLIHVNDRNFDHGNSGGPVFIEKGGIYYAIGIISAGVGSSVGAIVPVSASK